LVKYFLEPVVLPKKLWVVHVETKIDPTGNLVEAIKGQSIQVETAFCENVADFIEACKKKMELPGRLMDITLHLVMSQDPNNLNPQLSGSISPRLSLTDLVKTFGISKETTLAAKTPLPAESDGDLVPLLKSYLKENQTYMKENQTYMKENRRLLALITIQPDPDNLELVSVKSSKNEISDDRLRWYIEYGMADRLDKSLPKEAYCHISGEKVPLMYLTCSHIFQRRWMKSNSSYKIPDIDSAKNILIMLKIFELAFDQGRFILIPDKSGKIIVRILDSKLKKVKLQDDMKSQFKDYKEKEVDFGGKTVFGDYDGKTLIFHNDQRPQKRSLLIHALVSRQNFKMI
jgi:hypothetical protein